MTPLTCDLYDAHPLSAQVCETPLRDFGGRVRFHGGIVTVACFEDNSKLKELSLTPGGGRVIVVDGGASLRCALLGDIIAADLAKNGWAGVIVHGCVRDSAQLSPLDVGVKALGTVPRAPGKRGQGVIGEVLTFGGVLWRDSDVAFADEDGVVVLTAQEAAAL
jgi:regulator of ribonuclease activity A